MKIKGKRILKNGAVAGYVKQKDGSWKWRIISGPGKKKGGYLPKINKKLEELYELLKVSDETIRRMRWRPPRLTLGQNYWSNNNGKKITLNSTNTRLLNKYLNALKSEINNNGQYSNISEKINEIETLILQNNSAASTGNTGANYKNTSTINSAEPGGATKNVDNEDIIMIKLQNIYDVLIKVNTNKRSINTRVKTKETNTNLSIYKNKYDHKIWFIYRLIDIYQDILHRVLIHKNLKLEQLSFPNINRFIDLLMKVDINLSKCKINSNNPNFGKFIIIRHTETLENLIAPYGVKKLKKLQGFGNMAHFASHHPHRNSEISRYGLYMIENVYEQLKEDEKLRRDIINNFPLLLTSRKRRTHRTAKGTIQRIFHNTSNASSENESKFISRFEIYLFDEFFIKLGKINDPSLKLDEELVYELSDIFLSCLPTNNFIISGHSHWFQHFFSQKNDENLNRLLNPSKKMFNVQGLLYQYYIKNPGITTKNFRNSCQFTSCLFQPKFNEREQKIVNLLKEENSRNIENIKGSLRHQLNTEYFNRIQRNVQNAKNEVNNSL